MSVNSLIRCPFCEGPSVTVRDLARALECLSDVALSKAKVALPNHDTGSHALWAHGWIQASLASMVDSLNRGYCLEHATSVRLAIADSEVPNG